MTAYDPAHQPSVSPEDAAAVVHAFLVRCRGWATEVEIPKLLGRLEHSGTVQDAAKLHQWTTWRDFVDHALAEVRSGHLDDWLTDAAGAQDHD